MAGHRGPPDSGSGKYRPPRPLVVEDDETTDDEMTPVKHLLEEVGHIREVVADHSATIAERWAMPSSEAWAAMVKRLDGLEKTAAALEADRAKRATEAEAEVSRKEKRKKLLTAGGVAVAGSVLSILTWAVVELGNAGARRRDAENLSSTVRSLVERVEKIREQQVSDSALLHYLLRTQP